MAERQEQISPEASQQAETSGQATDYPKVKTPDQSDVPHHPAADPTQKDPYGEEEGSSK